MERFKPLAVAAVLAMSSAVALAQTVSPPTTETAKTPGATDPKPATAPAAATVPAPPADSIAPSPATSSESAPSVSPTTVVAPEAIAPDEAKLETAPTLTQRPGDIPSSKLIGASVYNTTNDNIGEIEDLIISASGSVSAVVVGVGGFLGIGEKKVAIPFNALRSETGDNTIMKFVIEGTKDNLKSMPDFKYANS